MISYFKELQSRFLLTIFSFFFLFSVCYFYKETLLFLIIKPNYLNLVNISFFYFIFTNVSEIFNVYFQLTLFICIQFLSLYTVYHMFIFLAPALFYKEFSVFRSFLLGVIFVLLITFNFINFLLVPLFWNFFLSFQTLPNEYSVSLHFEARLSEYLNFYIYMYYLTLFYFQFFIILFFLFYDIIYSIALIKKLRNIYYYILIIVSTFLAPPDVFSQLFLSFITILVYESSLFLVCLRISFNKVNS